MNDRPLWKWLSPLTALACGCVLYGLTVQASDVFGASPGVVFGALSAVLVGGGLASCMRHTGHNATWSRLAAVTCGAAAILPSAPLRMVLSAIELLQLHPTTSIAWMWPLGVGLAFAVFKPGATALRTFGPASAVFALLGALFAANLPAAWSIGGGIGIWLVLVAHAPTHAPTSDTRATLPLLAVAAIGGSSAVSLWALFRPALDPSAGAGVLTLLGSLAAAATAHGLAARLAPPRWTAPIMLGAVAAVPWLLGSVAPVPLNAWVADVIGTGHAAAALTGLLVLLGATSGAAGLASGGWRLGGFALFSGAVMFAVAGRLTLTHAPEALRFSFILTIALGTLSCWRAPHTLARVTSLALVGGALLTLFNTQLAPHPLMMGRWSAIGNDATFGQFVKRFGALDSLASDWGPTGSQALTTRAGAQVDADLEGRRSMPENGSPHTRRFAAHLGAILAQAKPRILVLGDDWGEQAEALIRHHSPTQVVIASPFALPLRERVGRQISADRALVDPRAAFVPTTSRWLTRTANSFDLVVETVLSGTADAAGALPSRNHARELVRVLGDDGCYVLTLSLTRVDWTEVKGVLAVLTEEFGHVTGWLPPHETDTIVLVATPVPSPPRLAIIEAGARRLRPVLEALDLNTPLDLADRATLSHDALAALAEGYPTHGRRSVRAHGLGPVLWPQLAHQLPDVTTLFSASADDPMLAILNERQQAKRAFFDFFTHSETQNVRALFDQAKTLRTSKAGARTLEPLIAPYLERGRAAIRQAQREGSLSPSWRLARDELTLALLLYPTHEPTHLLLGSLHETQRDWAAAAERYEAVLRQNDGQLAALFGLARIRKATGDRDAETALLRRARARHPGEWATHQNLAVTLIQLGELEEAKELLEQAARLAPSTTAEPHSGLAELHFAEENAPAALVEAERAVLIAPTAYHLFLRGRARLEIGDSERALRDFEKAVLTDTNFVLARATIGQIQAQRGQLDQAAVSFRAVLAQDPGNQAARENLEKIRAIETRRTPRAEENGAKPDESVVPEGSAQ